MTTVINMLFHQIVREKSVPLSLSLDSRSGILDELAFALLQRRSGYDGRLAEDVALEMEKVVSETEG
jgi:antitoxin component of RelBE/YafQ-DinJ toxin-antitoxin module